MLQKLTSKVTETAEKKRLFSNILSLGVLQAANYLLPLLTVPYLVRVLGPEYFGLLAFSTATVAYFMLITDYGFNLSATRQISIHRNEQEKVNEIFSAVMIIKFCFMLLSFILLALLVFTVDKFHQHWQLYFITFGMVIGQMLFPVWLFQGMEKMKYITYLNIAAKVFFTVCVFIFVKHQNDYLLVPLLTSLGFIVAGLCSFYFVRKELAVRFILPELRSIHFQLTDGWHIFFSSIAISMYTVSTTFILGLFTNNTVVGYFSAADKIVQAAKGIYQPVSQAIYPLIGKKLHEDKKSGLDFIYKATWIVGGGMLVISALLFVFAEAIVNLLLGAEYQHSILILRVMAFLPFIIALSNIFGIQTMLNLGYKKAFSRILILAAVLGFSLCIFLVRYYDGLGIAVTLLLVEVFVTLTMFFFLKVKLRNNNE
ncbi:transporter [Oceanisphaera marina]|uniref:Transporter n=1 Tax=Oceanisphaera marina TaxID=2017550 RepID=A0ABQ1IXY1_9GAMM|nr:flippase [Oceanisphaera marina]GGB53095.1 transporter [Oceanisphaera marina]